MGVSATLPELSELTLPANPEIVIVSSGKGLN